LLSNKKFKVLVVCMGNICRSPTGEAVLKAKAKDKGMHFVEVDSAGTIGFHTGNPPDPRSKKAGEARGYSFDGITSRKLTEQDFENFDLLLAADKANLSDMLEMAPSEHQHKVKLFLEFGSADLDEVPDPYYGGARGFEIVLDLIEEASDKVLSEIQRKVQ
jgi:protein-tyrosine phosphatase